MKKNIISIVVIAMSVLLFVGAYFLYGNLKDKYNPEDFVTESETTELNTSVYSEITQETHNYIPDEPLSIAPDFTVTDLDGNEVKLSDYNGKPIVINFWATWCTPCKSERPLFEKAYKENEDIQFLMVNLTSKDKLSSVNEIMAKNGYTFDVLLDNSGEASEKYGIYSIPTTYFIDKNGNIVNHTVGVMEEEVLNEKLDLIR